jgi:CRISPR type III-A-associated protein Csm2
MGNRWLDENMAIRPEALNEEAEKIAAGLFKQGRGKAIGVTSSQLRRIFNEVKGLERQLGTIGWDHVNPMVKMLRAKMAYTTGRVPKFHEERACYEKLQAFVAGGVNEIQTEKEFRAFCKQFEAVVGFYYGMTKGGI